MDEFIRKFGERAAGLLHNLPVQEIAKAMNLLQGCYERDGRVYIFGNGGSWSIAGHWVTDFNKTVFGKMLDTNHRRFRVSRIPPTEEELTAWANDIGYDMVFAGPLKNLLEDNDIVIAISSSGNSANIINAVQVAKDRHIPIIGLSGFDGGKLNELADAKILIVTPKGEYELVESTHDTIMHLMTVYFREYFTHLAESANNK